MRRASELIICFNIRSAGCDLVGRHGAKQTGCEHKQVSPQAKTSEQSACRSSFASTSHWPLQRSQGDRCARTGVHRAWDSDEAGMKIYI